MIGDCARRNQTLAFFELESMRVRNRSQRQPQTGAVSFSNEENTELIYMYTYTRICIYVIADDLLLHVELREVLLLTAPAVDNFMKPF